MLDKILSRIFPSHPVGRGLRGGGLRHTALSMSLSETADTLQHSHHAKD